MFTEEDVATGVLTMKTVLNKNAKIYSILYVTFKELQEKSAFLKFQLRHLGWRLIILTFSQGLGVYVGLIFSLKLFLLVYTILIPNNHAASFMLFFTCGEKKFGEITKSQNIMTMISIKLQSNCIEITLQHGCSVNLLHIYRKS